MPVQVQPQSSEYNLRIAIHNHGPGDKKYPSPLDVLRLVMALPEGHRDPAYLVEAA